MSEMRDTPKHRSASWLRDHIKARAKEHRLDIEGVEVAGEDLTSVMFEMVLSLTHCVLDRANLRGVHAPTYISGCSLIETRLDGAWLAKSQFTGCDLRGASLRDAKLSRTDFAKSDLRGASFSGADPFSRVGFYDCDLRGAYLTGLQFQAASFSGSSLSGIDLSLTTGSIFPRPINIGSPEEPRLVEGDEALRWMEEAGATDLSYVPLINR
jgi:uncharacterized protein YjbI with pentapeptide repeats